MSGTHDPQVAIVTGASSGIGKSIVHTLLKAGYIVHAAARRVAAMKELATAGARVHNLDLCDSAAIIECVGDILGKDGHVDLLVNNAGYGAYGAIEEVPMSEARAQMEVNLFACATLIQAVLPGMRERRRGRIINISSIGGKIWSPLGGWYHASKFALEGMSDCLRNEVRPFGIDVVVIEPAGIRTEWTGIAVANMLKASGSGPYGPIAKSFAALADGKVQRTFAEPQQIADVVLHAARVTRPRARYVAPWSGRLLLVLRRFLGDRAMDLIFGMALRLPKSLPLPVNLPARSTPPT